MGEHYLTLAGRERLQAELKEMVSVTRPRISREIGAAREQGDLSENAEYDAAKEAQAHAERRIAELESILSNVAIIEELNLPNDRVYIGSTVRLKDLDQNTELEYTLLGPDEADADRGSISTTSPIGKALLRHEVGDVVDIEIPSGALKCEILEIQRP